MDYKNETIVALKICDFVCHPNNISEILNIVPTKICHKNEYISEKATIKFKQNMWVFEIRLNDVVYVENLINKIRDIFENKEENFKKLPKKCYIELSIVCYLEKGMPSIHFDKKNIEFFTNNNVEIDIDLYGL